MLQLAIKARIQRCGLRHLSEALELRISFHSTTPTTHPFYFLLVLSSFLLVFFFFFRGGGVLPPALNPNLYRQVCLIASVKNQKLVRCNDYLHCDTYHI